MLSIFSKKSHSIAVKIVNSTLNKKRVGEKYEAEIASFKNGDLQKPFT